MIKAYKRVKGANVTIAPLFFKKHKITEDMTHLFAEYRQHIISAVESLQGEGLITSDALPLQAVTCEPPRDASHGDLSTNAAMVLAKPAKKGPRDIAVMLQQKLANVNGVRTIDIAGPGFINITLDKEIWQNVIPEILNEGTSFGDSAIGKNEKVNIEYVSANPTGPMHIGHARGAVYGDALASLLEKAGYAVTKEYYINDAGSQIDTLARSTYLRYQEALGRNIGAIPEGLYPGDYLVPVGKSLAEKYGDELLNKEEAEWLPLVKEYAIESMMSLIKNDLKNLGIEHNIFTSEKSLHDNKMIGKSLSHLEEKGLIYKGVLEAPKGKLPDDWEPREQTLFKATDFGDDVDRALQKSDGSWTYFAADAAYHLDKFKRGFNHMVIILGADHGGYVKRLKAVVKALSDGQADIDCKISQLVNFLDGGVPVKMSKRAGTFTTVGDVIDAVGKDIIRFIMLTRKNDAVLDFDLQTVKEQSKDNPVFYVQYAYARAKSVIRNAQKEAPEAYALSNSEPDEELTRYIETDDELSLIKMMASWPRIVEQAAIHHEPHRIAFYLQELAAMFHSLWNKGKDEAILRFILPENKELTAARLMMLEAMAKVIDSGLAVMGVTPMEEM